MLQIRNLLNILPIPKITSKKRHKSSINDSKISGNACSEQNKL